MKRLDKFLISCDVVP